MNESEINILDKKKPTRKLSHRNNNIAGKMRGRGLGNSNVVHGSKEVSKRADNNLRKVL